MWDRGILSGAGKATATTLGSKDQAKHCICQRLMGGELSAKAALD